MATHFANRVGKTGGLLIGGLALAFAWFMLDASGSLAQDGMQPASARMLLKGARELYAQGRYEEADGYYRRALISRDSLTPSEQHDLEAQLQQNAIALQSRQQGLMLLQQAQGALLQGKADEAESYMRLAQANQFLAPAHKQQLAGMQQSLNRLRAMPADADGKSLLARARQALNQGDLNTAEMLAHQAEKQASFFAPLAVWQDSPRAVLGDIRAARAKMPAGSAPMAVTTNYAPMQPGMAPGAVPQDRAQAKATARQFVLDGYKALEAGDLTTARRLGEQARAMNAPFDEWEPNPDRLLADVQRQTTAVQATAGATDARGMLRQARNLFQQQRLDEAEKLAIQSENMQNSRWGLFEDSPRKLRDEIVRARSQMDTDKANKLTIEARAALKRGDTAQARVFAQQAKSLQGTSSMFAIWADTPDAVLRDVARAEKLHPTPVNPNLPPPLPEGAVAQMPPPAGPGGLPIAPAPTIYSAEANNAAKMRAVGLLVEARQLGDQGHLAEARLKALEAEKVPAIWSPAEDCPGAVLRDLDTRASVQIKRLLDQATDLVLKNATDPTRFEKADGYLLSARRLAESFRLDLAPIDQKSQWIQQVANQSRNDPNAPAPIIRAAQAPGRSTSEMSEPVVRDAAAKLDQARRELRAGDIELARKLAVDAYSLVQSGVSPQMLEEATRVLHSIDDEEHAQTIVSARRNYVNAMEAYRQKDYRQTAMLLSSFDIRLLPTDQARRVEEIMSTPEMVSVQAKARGSEQIKQVAAVAPGAAPTTGPAGLAHATDLEDPQIAALREMKLLQYQKNRRQMLSAESIAETQLKEGSPKRAIETLTDCLTQLKTSGMDQTSIDKLAPSVEKRINDIQSAQAKLDLEREQKAAIKEPWNEAKYQEARKKTQDQIAVLMEKGRALYMEGKYEDALVQAKLVQELDPTSEAGHSLEAMAIRKKNVVAYENGRKAQEAENLAQLDPGVDPHVTGKTPWVTDKDILKNAMNRGEIHTPFIPLKTPTELAIERKLAQPITLDVHDQPLYRVLQDLQTMSGINIVPDKSALADKGISLEQSMSLNVDGISLKSFLSLLLQQARLTYVIRNEVIEITTTDNTRGKNRLKTYSVADLVVNNVPDNGTSATNSFDEALKRHINNGSGGVSYNAPTPYTGFNSMANGQSVSAPGSGAGYNNLNKTAGGPSGPGGPGGPGSHIEDTLIHLITSTIAPGTWDSEGGEGRIQYYPLGHIMVVSQVQEVQEDVQALLGALRKLQDIQISIEMRVVSVSESFYEQIGLNFDVNIRTNNNPNTINQLLLGAFTGPSQINRNLGVNGVVSGLTPGGQLTPDLSIPINSTSSQFAVPPFGGFPGTLSGDGGISLGLAFLSDIQVFMFLEAAQGDRRTHIMQAPKITVFNGQTANINVQDVMFFLTGVAVVQAGAQTFFVPQNNPFPIGVGMTVTPVVSADRRFVRVNLQPQLTNLVSPNIPLIPVQIPLPQLFDNVGGTGAIAGQPVIFQMFFQQPAFTTIQINTTVNVPDGGTVLLGGMKTLAEGRNEFGPPILSKIPYLDRLFRNTAFGRDTQSIMILVTPRIIINEEIQAELFGEAPPLFGAQQGQ